MPTYSAARIKAKTEEPQAQGGQMKFEVTPEELLLVLAVLVRRKNLCLANSEAEATLHPFWNEPAGQEAASFWIDQANEAKRVLDKLLMQRDHQESLS